MTAVAPAPAPVRTIDGHDVPAAGRWNVDASHTTVEFVARHLVVTKLRGRFTDYRADVVIGERPEDSTLNVEIDAASISTGDPGRDGHLTSPDFIDVANHPHITFRSTAVVPKGDVWKVTGDFAINGVSRPLTLDVEFTGVAETPWGHYAAFFTARGEFDREDWGLTWNQPLAGGGVLVGKKVVIELEVEAVQAPADEAASDPATEG